VNKFITFLTTIVILLFAHGVTHAQSTNNEYTIESFSSEIDIQKDTSIRVKESIVADFNTYKHGIYRIIPVTYSANGKTIKAKFKIESITDEYGNDYKYTQSKVGRNINLKIGDPNKTITGDHTYIITYNLTKVLQRFDTHDEFYWNVTGSDWDTNIEYVSANVESPYADIDNSVCYAGYVGTNTEDCQVTENKTAVSFYSNSSLGSSRDMTIVVALNKDNQLQFPTKFESFMITLADNWDYIPALLPLIIMILIWYKKGRDKKYAEGGEYYTPKSLKEKSVSIFERKHLPTVYAPIQGFTPSEIGTIIDEKVDIEDVVAEIIELARLDYIGIVKLSDKKLFKSAEYAFINKKTDTKDLNDYQLVLINNIFKSAQIDKSQTEFDRKLKNDTSKTTLELIGSYQFVLLSQLKNKFYAALPDFKKKLYQKLADDKVFDGSPDKVRGKWLALFIVLLVLSVLSRFYFLGSTGNLGPLILTLVTAIPGLAIAFFMPRKSAMGYSIYRQAEGLKFYLGKGKWRHDIYEKRLFLEETLPLAISLGVVDKLAEDMADLNMKPPSYMNGFAASTFSSDMNSFNTTTASSLASAPKSSGSSWSGGSGFSGGSGGGFGGGRGGSW
jgi:uncharacterized membrane protein YgcG